jgi:aspartate aminotransferase-like enzyme
MNVQKSTAFGPNSEIHTQLDVIGSHRDENFRHLYQETLEALQDLHQLNDFDLIFLPGGGTLGVEAVISSSLSRIKVVGVDGVFKQRWTDMANIYNSSKEATENTLSCHLETSNSTFQDLGTHFLDVVSSFPYYSIPDTCNVFVAASNKQLNALAGLSIVGVRKGMSDGLFSEPQLSYLSVRRYLHSALNHELPSTVGTYLFDSLLRGVRTYNRRDFLGKLDSICDEFVRALGNEAFIGDKRGPVLTIRRDALPVKIFDKWTLYEKGGPVPTVQVFTYSAPTAQYEEFLNDLEKAR